MHTKKSGRNMLFQPTESSSNEVLTIFAIILGIIHLISHWKRWKDIISEHYRKESGYIVVNKAVVLMLYFLVCVILGHCLGNNELLNIKACGTLITLEAFCITALFQWQLNGAILLQSTVRLFIVPAVKLTHFMIVGYGVPCLLCFIVIVSSLADKDFLSCKSSSVYPQNATIPASVRKCSLSQCSITSNLQGTILKTLVILLPMLVALIATAVQFAKIFVAMWTTWNRIAKSTEARVKDFAYRLGLLRLIMNFHVMLMILLSTVAIFYAPEEYRGIANTVFSACITGANDSTYYDMKERLPKDWPKMRKDHDLIGKKRLLVIFLNGCILVTEKEHNPFIMFAQWIRTMQCSQPKDERPDFPMHEIRKGKRRGSRVSPI